MYHYNLWGTSSSSIDGAIAVMTSYTRDRVLLRTVSDLEVTRYLGHEVHYALVSKPVLSDGTVPPLIRYAAAHEPFLYKITTTTHGGLVSFDRKLCISFAEDDMDYPGPVGAFCLYAGKTFWGTPPLAPGMNCVGRDGTPLTIRMRVASGSDRNVDQLICVVGEGENAGKLVNVQRAAVVYTSLFWEGQQVHHVDGTPLTIIKRENDVRYLVVLPSGQRQLMARAELK